METQDQICLYCRCRRIYEDKIGRCAAQVSRRSHCCKKNKFIEPAAKTAVDKEWENLRKYRHGSWQKSETKKRWPKKQGIRAEKFRGDIVKDDSRSYAVFTEQGSSASQMTAAKIMDIISRLPGCGGQAADAVSAYTQEKWKILTNYWKFQNRSVQTFGSVYHDTNGQNHGPVWKTQSFLLNEICTVILLAGLLWERQFEKILLKFGWEKVSNWECLFVHRERGLLFFVFLDYMKLAGKKQNLDPMWKVLNKEVDLGEPTSFLNGQGDGAPKAGQEQAAADSRGSRTCVCANTFDVGGGTRRRGKDELTSCRGTVWSAWHKPPVRRKGGRAGLPKKGKWLPRGTGTTVLTYPGSAPR